MDIKTFVFFDCETTGLPNQENNTTRITELCLIAVESDHISSGTIPRIQNKLNLFFKPNKDIQPKAAEISQLSNDLLRNQPEFSHETFGLIRDFLVSLSQPVCLVAHNGNQFDYPILKAEFNRSGNALPEEMRCVDSILAFRAMYDEGIRSHTPGRSPSFKLVDLYTTLTSKLPTDAHKAEYDVGMLIECAVVLSNWFVNWSNVHARRFGEIPGMRPGYPIGT